MDPRRLIIVDGYSLLYRAFYSTRMLSTTDGRPTNALFGFASMLFNLIEQQKPQSVLVALDAPGKTFRHAEYAEYKGTRREMPEEMKSQMPVARELLTALGIAQIELTGFEADDIIGTISLQAESNGYHTTIVTGDLDALQLVDECVTVVTPKVGVTEVSVYDPGAVFARYGFPPVNVPDYKALAGDSSDNIPGVPGIGEKSATKLIQQFGSVEVMLERLDEVEEKFKKKIEPVKHEVPKSKWLATIDRKAPITWDFAVYHLSSAQFQQAQAMLESLEFKSLVRRLPKVLGEYVEGGSASEAVTSAVVTTEKIETNDLGKRRALSDLQLWLDGRPYSAVIGGAAQPGMFDEEPAGEVFVAVGKDFVTTDLSTFLALFAEAPGRAVLHDSKSIFRKLPPQERPPARFDASLAGYVLQSDRSQYLIGDLIQGYLDAQSPTTFAEQAVGLGMLEAPMQNRLDKEGQAEVLNEIEMPLAPILAEMEARGIAMKPEFLVDFSSTLQVQIAELTAKIHEQAGQEFLIASPKQLGEVLFDKLMIPGGKKTKTGFATGAEILQLLAPEYPICADVLSWRELTKLKSTYSDSLPRLVAADGRIHTTFAQTIAATGRLSSNDPNLQNIPIRTELGREIRKAFVAAPGKQLLSFDYSQIELRLLAHLCEDPMLCDAFQKRVDVHAVTAALMFGIPETEVTKEQRRVAKMLNYAVLYGVTDFGLANQLSGEFSIAEARELIKQYNERFPTVKRFTESIVEEARSKGFTTTMKGRRRYFANIHAANRNERMYAERQAMNAPIQGAAADMIKIAMIKIRKKLGNSNTAMLLQVHDELVFDFDSHNESLISMIRDEMEQAMPLQVPVEADARLGPTWGDMTEITLAHR